MVQFGRHVDVFVQQENAGTGLFVVPYNDVKQQAAVVEDSSSEQEHVFQEQWRDNLRKASADFERAVGDFWATVFEPLPLDEARGALPGVAIARHIQVVAANTNDNQDAQRQAAASAAQTLLVRLKQIYEAAYHNTEALRKLVKKYDKQQQQTSNNPATLSRALLPAVYSANFTLGLPTLEEGIALLRKFASVENDSADEERSKSDGALLYPSPSSDDCDSDRSNAIVEDRQTELDWLRRLTASMAEQGEQESLDQRSTNNPQDNLLRKLVAHRGFHSIEDHIHRRPNENSLAAYETAWTHGICLCECDIALTKDEQLILAHDEDFSRLALNKEAPLSRVKVQDLTFRELLALPLTSASRPPLLVDVLRSAQAFENGEAQLVIEIKPGNEAAATALANLLQDCPQFLPCVAVIMSFDAYTMHKLKRELQHAFFLTVGAGATSANDMTTIGGGATAATTDMVPQSPLPLGLHHRRRSSRISFGSGLDLLTCSSPALTAAWSSRKQFVSQGDLMPNKAFGATPSPLLLGQKQFPSNNDFLNGFSVGLPLTASAKEMCSNSSSNLVQPFTNSSRHSNSGSMQPPPPPPTQFPKLMLLTVSDPPKRSCELRVSIDDLGVVESSLVSSEHGSLDGVYLQYQPEMLTPGGAAAVRSLAQNYSVGVWTHSGKDPDDYATFVSLTSEAGASFVNTDLPESFRRDVVPPPKRSFGGGGARRALSAGGSSNMSSSTVG